jgi:deoxyribonuclease V
VYYHDDNTATAAGILFSDWQSTEIEQIVIKQLDNIECYQPGSFYKRELPCILSLLDEVKQELEMIIIDGYITLGTSKKPGLGMHLYESLNKSTPVIGIAKNEFTDTPKECRLYRGNSKTPLYISSIGIPLSAAKSLVAKMHGKYRIPTLLKKVDQLSRGTCQQ